MRSGLPAFLPALFSCALAFALPASGEDSVILHVIKSPGINWSSPRSLARSTIDLRNNSFSIGHMTVEVRCGNRRFKTGMIQKYGSETTRVVQKEEQALGVLYHPFKGRHQTDAGVNNGLKRMLSSRRLAVLKFLVSRESCERMVDFHDVFTAKGMGRNYGTLSRPLRGEGGGCSAYALAYPAVGGFLEPWMVRAFARYHRVPRNWVGGPLTRYRIGVLKLYRKAPTRWARESERGFPLFLYDPDKVFRWAKARHAELSSPGAVGDEIRKIPVSAELLGIPVGTTPAFALEIDRRSVLPPAEINFSEVVSNPSRVLRNPSELDSWWEEEIRILREGHEGVHEGA